VDLDRELLGQGPGERETDAGQEVSEVPPPEVGDPDGEGPGPEENRGDDQPARGRPEIGELVHRPRSSRLDPARVVAEAPAPTLATGAGPREPDHRPGALPSNLRPRGVAPVVPAPGAPAPAASRPPAPAPAAAGPRAPAPAS